MNFFGTRSADDEFAVHKSRGNTEASHTEGIKYELNVPFDQLDLKKFAFYSSLSFFAESLVYYPLDVIRTRLQVQREPFSLSAFVTQVRQLGIRGLYRGFVASAATLPSFGLYFLSYNYCKDRLQAINDSYTLNKEHKTSMWVACAAAVIADVVSNGFMCPVEVVVQRLQVAGRDTTRYSSGLDATRKIWKEEGIRGFYRGFGATLMTYAPGSAVWWMTYEYYKAVFSKLISNRHQQQDGSVVVEQSRSAQILGGFIAGAVTVVVTNPLDVIKTRLQTQHGQLQPSGKDKGSPKIYAHSWEAFVHIVKYEGVSAFRKGLVPRMLISSVISPVASVVYELVLELSRKSSPQSNHLR